MGKSEKSESGGDEKKIKFIFDIQRHSNIGNQHTYFRSLGFGKNVHSINTQAKGKLLNHMPQNIWTWTILKFVSMCVSMFICT